MTAVLDEGITIGAADAAARSVRADQHVRVVRVLTYEGSGLAVDYQIARSLPVGGFDRVVNNRPIRITVTQGPIELASIPADWPARQWPRPCSGAADRALLLYWATGASAQIRPGVDEGVDLWWPGVLVHVRPDGSVEYTGVGQQAASARSGFFDQDVPVADMGRHICEVIVALEAAAP